MQPELVRWAEAQDAIRQGEERYRALFENASDIVFTLDLDGRFTSINRTAERISGYSRQEAMEMTIADVLSSEDSTLAWQMIRQKLAGEPDSRYVVDLITRQGRHVAIELATTVMHENGRPVGIQGIARDVSERKRAEDALRASEERYRTVVETSPDSVIVTDLQGRVIMANGPAATLLGYDNPSSLIGLDCFQFIAPEFRAQATDGMRRLVDRTHSGDLKALRYELLQRDGTPVPVEVSAAVITNDEGEPSGFLAISRDITERQRTEERLAHLAMHDALTGLPNRALLHDRATQAIAAARRSGSSVALLLMDLDRFKDVNDTLGHQFGDTLLQHLAVRILDVLRRSDTVGRLGGDEFAVVLPQAGAIDVERVAEKLLRTIEQPIEIEGRSITIGGSIGISLFPEHGDSMVTLLQRADVAMYVAKRGGSGVAVYSPDQDENSPHRLMLSGELRQAIDAGQFVLHYQPKVDVRTGRVVAVEALVRWQHAQRGLLAPAEFIPLAEHTGLIRPLSGWILGNALRHQRLLCDKGLAIPVAVNLSAQNLQDEGLPTTVRALLEALNLQANSLQLEVTESAVMYRPERASSILKRLHDTGIVISVDDFGTGYSSLAHLQRLPVNEIKIDKSFVQNMTTNESDAFIARTVIDLGHNLGLRVVAEGVEDQESLLRLAEMQCDLAQGYYISHPLPIDDLVVWLQRHDLDH